MKLNEQGITLVETVLGVAILSMIALTLLPLLHQLQGQLYSKKLALHASEVALNGAQYVYLFGQTQGQMQVNDVLYHWRFNQGQICVDYEDVKQFKQICIDEN